MKVEIEQVKSVELEHAHICAYELSDAIQQARQLLENNLKGILVTKDEKHYVCELDKIYYIEAVDNKSFVYTKSECFESKSRLYELENMLDYRFFRCSKSMICNMRKIKSVRTEYNARMQATLLNNEVIVINRSYVKELKKRLGM